MTQAPRVGLFAVLHASGVLESRTELKLAEVGLSLPKLAALHRLTDAGGSLPLGRSCVFLSGLGGNDVLVASASGTRLNGGSGDDTLIGVAGAGGDGLPDPLQVGRG